MNRKYLKSSILVSVALLLMTANSYAQKDPDEQHIGVSMRMIGHELLLHSGDSVSRILPIEKKENQYKIKFESSFQFDPTKLVETVSEIIEGKNIAKNYLVEVGQEGTNKVVYSYEMTNLESENLIPCGGRIQPKDNYNLSITFLETKQKMPLNNLASADKSGGNYWIITALLIALSLSIGIYFFIRKKRGIENKNESENKNPNIISIGKYEFDTINMELSYMDSKVELTGKEGNLLLLLYHLKNETVEREQILKQVWGDEGDYVGRTLDVFISKLRKKLKADDNVKIVNIRGVGYKLVIGVAKVY
jgi:DNA-binding winged helix-turn-helix (wHTH) protein